MKISKILLKTLPIYTAMFSVGTQVLSKDIEIIEYSNYKNNGNINNKDYSNVGVKSNIMLVNKYNELDSKYEPENLVNPNIPFVNDSIEDERYMQDIAAQAIEELFYTAKYEGIELIATSAYRSYQKQLDTYTKRVNLKGKEEADKYVAQPGKSEHQTGLSIDITNRKRRFTKHCKEARWLAKNAHRFGFILRYPEGKEHITGILYEPWHVRYVGKEVAKNIFERGITLEEYIKNKTLIQA